MSGEDHPAKAPSLYEVHMPTPTPEQVLALRGLATAFGWHIHTEDVSEPIPSPAQPQQMTQSDHVAPEANLVLRDSNTDILLSNPHQEAKQLEASAVLKSIMEQTVAPYNQIFDHKVPDARQDSRYRHLPLKRTRWAHQATLDTTDFVYTYDLYYSPQGRRRKNRQNILESVAMELSTPAEIERRNSSPFRNNSLQHIARFGMTGPLLELNFNNHQIVLLSLRWNNDRDALLKQLSAGKPLEEFIKGFEPPSDSEFSQRQSFSIVADLIAGSLKATSYFINRPNGNKDDAKLYMTGGEFRLNPSGDGTFMMLPNDRTGLALCEQLGKDQRSSLTLPEYTEVVQGLLGLIPTIDTNNH